MLIALSVLFASCEKMVKDVELPDYEPQLVVYSFLSPDEDWVNVYVSESVPVFGTPGSDIISEPIQNATVKLKKNGNAYNLPYTGYPSGYSISMSEAQLQPGGTYTIEVSVPDGRAVSGVCTIPYKRNQTLEITSVTREWIDFDSSYIFQLKFRDDNPGEGDYFRMWATYTMRYEEGGETYVQSVEFEKGDPYLSDENKDGASFSYRTSVYSYGLEKVTFYLLTTDEAYYTYHRSVEYNTGDSPFSEPTLVYSNISGGLGVISGYRMFRLEYEM
jgi:hypothetical protein